MTAIGCRVNTAEEAANFGDVSIVAVPFSNYPAIPAAAVHGKVVMDTCNYYPEDD